MGFVAEAIDELEKQVAAGSATAMTHALLGKAWLLAGCYSCAVAPLEKALAESSGPLSLAKEEAGVLLVECYRQLQRPADAARVETLSASAPKAR
jgi:lipopolysaccharide biosynthesis regulator YciM